MVEHDIKWTFSLYNPHHLWLDGNNLKAYGPHGLYI